MHFSTRVEVTAGELSICSLLVKGVPLMMEPRIGDEMGSKVALVASRCTERTDAVGAAAGAATNTSLLTMVSGGTALDGTSSNSLMGGGVEAWGAGDAVAGAIALDTGTKGGTGLRGAGVGVIGTSTIVAGAAGKGLSSLMAGGGGCNGAESILPMGMRLGGGCWAQGGASAASSECRLRDLRFSELK